MTRVPDRLSSYRFDIAKVQQIQGANVLILTILTEFSLFSSYSQNSHEILKILTKFSSFSHYSHGNSQLFSRGEKSSDMGTKKRAYPHGQVLSRKVLLLSLIPTVYKMTSGSWRKIRPPTSPRTILSSCGRYRASGPLAYCSRPSSRRPSPHVSNYTGNPPRLWD